MWQRLRPSRAPAAAEGELIIAPHHPDRLRRPAPPPGAVARVRLEQALAWNVFRTLELIAPSFWLRRFHARLLGEPLSLAPQIVRVSLWRPLPLPPIQRIDGFRHDAQADVLIETEHAVWTLLLAADEDVRSEEPDRVAPLMDAGAWFAGARDHYCGLLERDGNDSVAAVLTARYARSRESALLRSETRGPVRPRLRSLGAVQWTALASILHDCAEAPSIAGIERSLARHALAWLERAGITPASC